MDDLLPGSNEDAHSHPCPASQPVAECSLLGDLSECSLLGDFQTRDSAVTMQASAVADPFLSLQPMGDAPSPATGPDLLGDFFAMGPMPLSEADTQATQPLSGDGAESRVACSNPAAQGEDPGGPVIDCDADNAALALHSLSQQQQHQQPASCSNTGGGVDGGGGLQDSTPALNPFEEAPGSPVADGSNPFLGNGSPQPSGSVEPVANPFLAPPSPTAAAAAAPAAPDERLACAAKQTAAALGAVDGEASKRQQQPAEAANEEDGSGSRSNPFLAQPEPAAAEAAAGGAEAAAASLIGRGGSGGGGGSNPFLVAAGCDPAALEGEEKEEEARASICATGEDEHDANNPFLLASPAAVTTAADNDKAGSTHQEGEAAGPSGGDGDRDRGLNGGGRGGRLHAPPHADDSNPFLAGSSGAAAAASLPSSPPSAPGIGLNPFLDPTAPADAADEATHASVPLPHEARSPDASNPFLLSPTASSGPLADPDVGAASPVARQHQESDGGTNPFVADADVGAASPVAQQQQQQHRGSDGGGTDPFVASSEAAVASPVDQQQQQEGSGGINPFVASSQAAAASPVDQQQQQQEGGGGSGDGQHLVMCSKDVPQVQHVGLALPAMSAEEEVAAVHRAINRVAAAALRAGGALGCVPRHAVGGGGTGSSSSSRGVGSDGNGGGGGGGGGGDGGNGVLLTTLKDLEGLLFQVQTQAAAVAYDRDQLAAENARIAGDLVASKLSAAALQEDLVKSRRELVREQQLLQEHIAWQASRAAQRLATPGGSFASREGSAAHLQQLGSNGAGGLPVSSRAPEAHR